MVNSIVKKATKKIFCYNKVKRAALDRAAIFSDKGAAHAAAQNHLGEIAWQKGREEGCTAERMGALADRLACWLASNVAKQPPSLEMCLVRNRQSAGSLPLVMISLYKSVRGAWMIYGLTNSKGGVGKTTIAVHLAAFLAAKKRTVIFIDADPQQSASAWINELGRSVSLETLDDPEEIIRRVAKLAADADDIIIDGPAGLSETTRAIMLRADRVFLPCGPSILDLRAASKAVLLLQEAQQARKGLPKGALIPNKLQKRGRLSREMLAAVHKLKIPVLAGLSQRQAFADAAGQARVVSDMGASALLASHEMKQLLKEMTRG